MADTTPEDHSPDGAAVEDLPGRDARVVDSGGPTTTRGLADLFTSGTTAPTWVPTPDQPVPGALMDRSPGMAAAEPGRTFTDHEARPEPAKTSTTPTGDVYDPAEAPIFISAISAEDRAGLEGHVAEVVEVIQADLTLAGFASQLAATRDHAKEYSDRTQLRDRAAARAAKVVQVMPPQQVDALFDLVYDDLVGLGPLGPPWRDDRVTEIIVDAPDRIYVEIEGRFYDTALRFRSLEHAQNVARGLAARYANRALDLGNPLVTAQIDNARANFVMGPTSATGISIVIRKFSTMMDVDGLLAVGAWSSDMVEFLAQAVRARATIIVSGGTGAGKTTVINALSGWIPDSERVLTIEDAFELQLRNRRVQALQTKEAASSDDTVRIDQEALMVNALRMRPDRIIIGEIREPRATAVMLQAASTGHEGTMTTIHADSPHDCLNDRFGDMLRTIGMPQDVTTRRIASAVDLVVQVTRQMGRRFVSEIATVDLADITPEGVISARPVFTGKLVDGAPHFEFLGLDPTSGLAAKLHDSGVPTGRWTL